MDDSTKRWQFTLRQLFGAVTVAAVVCGTIRWFGVWNFLRLFEEGIYKCPSGGIVIPAVFGLLCAIGTRTLARHFALSVRLSLRWSPFIVFFLIAVLALAYTAWARERVVYGMADLQYCERVPHPDWATLKLHGYLESLAPTPPGTFSYDGKWPLLKFILQAAVFVLSGITGLCFGFFVSRFPRPAEGNTRPERSAFRRYAKYTFLLTFFVALGWVLVKMEQIRRQWTDESRWADAGACASYREGKLVGLRFNTLTLSLNYYGHVRRGDADLGLVKDRPDLIDLGLTDWELTDDGLGQLQGSLWLRWLELDGTQVTDAGLHHLTKFPYLLRLDLSRTRVTAKGLEALSQLEYLRIVILDETDMSDASIPYLGRLDRLDYLGLHKTRVTEDGIKQLRAALPNCSIYN